MPQIVGGGVLMFIGVLWLLERTAVFDLSVTAVLAMATMVIGIALMFLSTEGPHGGLIVLGTVLAVITLITAAAPFEGFQGGVGDRSVELTSVDEIRPDYNLAMGKLTIDLRQIDDLGAVTTLTASVGTGELIIRIPEGIAIDLDARVGAGQLEILGQVIDGLGIDETYQSPGYSEARESLKLDLQAFTGRVEVTDE
ncbi:MAG TPA: LiaF domain-containing protein [Acidimicrobiia bacterium]|nr:LiaF domain-containing protein [Acidimicrobiia bacterium]